MSKYYREEDIVNMMEQGFSLDTDGDKAYVIHELLPSLPTIETSEDCISRQYVRLIESDEDAYHGDWNETYERGFADAINKVLDAPSVIPKAKEGEWILECDAEGEGDNLYRCPECGQRCGCQEYDLPNYCGHCGRKLKGAEDEVVDFQIIETPNCSECEHYEDHHTSLACATCPVITKVWGGTKK